MTEFRRLGDDVHLIRTAAVVEAVAAGHDEVDVDHLLLGLIATGGPAGRRLAGAGAGLPAVRRATAELIPGPPRRTIRAVDRRAATRVPLTRRAEEVLRSAPHRGDDRGLLLALLDEGSGRVRRLLEHAGVDVDELREPVALGARPAGTPAPETPGEADDRLPGPLPAGTTWAHASYAQALAVPADRVWALVSDPARRTEWDVTCSAVSVTDDGVEHLTGPDGRTTTQTVVSAAPPREIVWSRPGRDSRDLVRVTVTGREDGAVVHLRRSWPVRGRVGRLLRPLAVRTVRTLLRILAQGIGQAAA